MRSAWKTPNLLPTLRLLRRGRSNPGRPQRVYGRRCLFSAPLVGRTLAIHTGRAFFNLVVRPALVGQGVHAFALSRRMGHGIHRFVKKLAPARRSGKANRSK